jgi:alginate O-acetyltransferase complex protein AlgI
MLFNSVDFAFFFPIVFLLYWLVANKNLKIQNALILVASYYFYSCWDWRFVFLLAFSTLLDYFTGIKMCESENQNKRRFWFWLSIIINLGFLGVFKYYNFFIESLSDGFSLLGIHFNPATLSIILPVGISFYTFHGLSYVIDIYNKKIRAERNLIDYAVFVSFFPLLVAGPIERATHLLPQIKQTRVFTYAKAVSGLRQILWGLFKKVVIADSCAEFANLFFNNTADYSGFALIAGAVFFAIQIYGDFSGYSDIALGTARLLGFDLLQNFSFPYFSRDIAEFWRRWHISLSSWFRDYLYIPLGGSKGGTWLKVRNTFFIFLVSGFWHGANWTFIAWGTLNALYFLPLLLTNNNRNHLDIVAKGRFLPSMKEFTGIIVTFSLTTFAWIFFRAESMSHAFLYIQKMVTGLFTWQETIIFDDMWKWGMTYFVFAFFLIEWLGREQRFALETIPNKWPKIVRYVFYYVLILAVFWYGGKEEQFIYFQF